MGYFSDLIPDGQHRAFYLLFVARFFRMYSYGLLSVILFLFLVEIGLTNIEAGVVLTATMVGDLVLTFILTTRADSWGRRRTLMVGAGLKLFAGAVFVSSNNVILLVIAGTIGVITPNGKEVGPFQPVEQAALTEIIENSPGGKDKIARLFGVYQIIGSVASASGLLSSGWIVTLVHTHTSVSLANCYRIIVLIYAILGAAMSFLYYALPENVESAGRRANAPPPPWFGKFGLRRPESRRVVFRISLLFIMDAFFGGFVPMAITSAWFRIRFGMSEGLIGSMLTGADLISAVSALAVTPLVARIGAIHTMVLTHIPSNIFLFLIPLMPTAGSAVAMLVIRASLSQMDVPARQSYVAMVVEHDERSAAGGITNLVRSIGVAFPPLLSAIMLENPHSFIFLVPFFLAGTGKILYDILVYIAFRYEDVGKLPDKEPKSPPPQLASETELTEMQRHTKHDETAIIELNRGGISGDNCDHEDEHRDNEDLLSSQNISSDA